MARRSRKSNNNDTKDLLMEDELTAAFLGEDDNSFDMGDDRSGVDDAAPDDVPSSQPEEEDWDDEPTGQLAVDVYETQEKLIIKARTAGVDRNELDVSIADNILSIRGTLSAGEESDVKNYFVQECYWGEFSRSVTLPVPVKEDHIEAVLKDGVLKISFVKLKQDTVKKIQIN